MRRSEASIRRSRLALLGIGLVLVALATLIDRAAFHATYVGAGRDASAASAARDAIAKKDWYQALRAVGYLPTWVALGLACLVVALAPARARGVASPPGSASLGIRLIIAPLLAGGLAEALRPIVGRVRPLFTDGQTMFGSVPGLAREQISFGGASSHAAVAFGGAFALVLAHPRLAWIALPLAAGCGYTRMLSGAHFLSDVLAGAVLGYLSAMLVGFLQPRRP